MAGLHQKGMSSSLNPSLGGAGMFAIGALLLPAFGLRAAWWRCVFPPRWSSRLKHW